MPSLPDALTEGKRVAWEQSTPSDDPVPLLPETLPAPGSRWGLHFSSAEDEVAYPRFNLSVFIPL